MRKCPCPSGRWLKAVQRYSRSSLFEYWQVPLMWHEKDIFILILCV